MSREFEAKVQQVTSGDDMYLLVSLGVDELYKRVRVRLSGVDTPDAYQKPAESEACRIRKEVSAKIKDKNVKIEIVAVRSNSWSVILFYPDRGEHKNLNDELMAQGFVYKGRKA